MHKIDSDAATDDNRFTDGDPTIPIAATVVDADWLNAVQEEIVAVIEAAGITLNKESNAQLKDALEIMLAEWTPDATATVAGILKLATQAQVDTGTNNDAAVTPLTLTEILKNYGPHFVGQWVQLRNSIPPTGYYVRNGALIENASTTVPKLWAYLQESANIEQCITQTEWDTMQAATYTLSDDDETEVPIWDGVGGVPYYVLDTEADTLRLPDTRGMYAEDAGFDGLAVGGSHGDMIRNIEGTASSFVERLNTARTSSGALTYTHLGTQGMSSGSVTAVSSLALDTSLDVPTGNANKPRGYGMLGCIYAG